VTAIGAWQTPVNPYPPTPHLLDRQTSPDKAIRLVISKVEAQGGAAIFIAYGRSAKRLMDEVCRILPAGHLGQTVTLDTSTELPGALGRKARRELRLRVQRKLLLPHQAHASGPAPPGPGKIWSSCSIVSSPSRSSRACRAPSSCPTVRGPMIGAVTTGLASSQARAT
jgi:hypothetical protein